MKKLLPYIILLSSFFLVDLKVIQPKAFAVPVPGSGSFCTTVVRNATDLNCTGVGECGICLDRCATGTSAWVIKDKDNHCYASESQCICACTVDVGFGTVKGNPTALGCIPYEANDLVSWLLWFAARILTGISLLLLLYGGLKYVMSSGSPDAVEEAKSTITAAVSGLLLIIFSVLILRVVGVDILRLDLFGGLPGGGLKIGP